MSTNDLNRVHGTSVVTVVPYDRQAILSKLSDVDTTDPNFEIVYVATEAYSDGTSTLNVVYRISDPTPQPPAPRNMPVKKPQPLTLVLRLNN